MAAGQDVLQKLIGRAMIDPVFRDFLLRDPMAATASLGLEISEAQALRIKELDPKALQVVVASFQEGTGMGFAAGRPLW
jgi:hypothetical protein